MSIWPFTAFRTAGKTTPPPSFTIRLPDPLHPHSFGFVLSPEQIGFLKCVYLAYESGPGDGKAQVGISFIRDEAPYAAGQSTDMMPAMSLRHLFWIPEIRPSSSPGSDINIFTIPKDLELKAGDRILFVTSKTAPVDKFKNIFLTLTKS